MGTVGSTGDIKQKEAAEVLSKHGLPVHDITEEDSTLDSLGVEFGPRGCKTKRSRRIRLQQAVQYVIKKPFLSGHQLEILVGHFTYCFLLSRACMCIFKSCYAYIHRRYNMYGRVWRSALHELVMAADLLPLVCVDFDLPWSSTVHVSDACTSGYAMHAAQWHIEHVHEVGSISERWRYRITGSNAARQRAARCMH